jgi:hypothetical protein
MYDGGQEERKVLRAQHLEKPNFNVLVTHYDLVIRDKASLKRVLSCAPAKETARLIMSLAVVVFHRARSDMEGLQL